MATSCTLHVLAANLRATAESLRVALIVQRAMNLADGEAEWDGLRFERTSNQAADAFVCFKFGDWVSVTLNAWDTMQDVALHLSDVLQTTVAVCLIQESTDTTFLSVHEAGALIRSFEAEECSYLVERGSPICEIEEHDDFDEMADDDSGSGDCIPDDEWLSAMDHLALDDHPYPDGPLAILLATEHYAPAKWWYA